MTVYKIFKKKQKIFIIFRIDQFNQSPDFSDRSVSKSSGRELNLHLNMYDSLRNIHIVRARTKPVPVFRISVNTRPRQLFGTKINMSVITLSLLL